MSVVLAAIGSTAGASPRRTALVGDEVELRYQDLVTEVKRLHQWLAASGYRSVGMLLDNGPAWVVIDLAAQQARIVLVPLPAFFSTSQLLHTVRDAGVDVLLTDTPETLSPVLVKGGLALHSRGSRVVAGRTIHVLQVGGQAAQPHRHSFAKITYTSGTTGAPKGVCLEQGVIDAVAQSLLIRVTARSVERHLSVLPLTTLLENIGGVYVPLLAGRTCCVPSLHSIGVLGAAGIDIARMAAALSKWRASSAIFVPQMLQRLVKELECGAAPPPALRFLAVGGAPVSQRLVRRTLTFGLPVYEGYGLSECASVVAVNGPGERQPGSVGKPLPHVRLRFAGDGEILVSGAVFSGYLGDAPAASDRFVRTGDLGYLDKDSYLHITGRKKNMFVTSFGRNVAPEWVERELALQPGIAQAAVFGEGRPWNTAVIVPAAANGDGAAAITSAITQTNTALPDYARVSSWLVADAPFSVANGQLTPSGHLRRDAIWTCYATRIEQMYAQSLKEQQL